MKETIIPLLVVLLALTIPVQAGEIHSAAQRGDLDAVKKLLAEQQNLISERDEAGSTPLHVAAMNGNRKLVKYLLKRGAEIDAGDNENSTPLHVAAMNGHKDVVEYLISKGADLNLQDDNGMSTLHWAAYFGHLDVAEYLLKKGANLEAKKTAGATPMHGAAYHGHLEMVKFLVRKGANIEAKNNYGFTPLLSAAAGGQREIVEYMAGLGARLNVEDQWHQSPLFFAVESGDREFVEFLLSQGLEVKSDDPEARDPLASAAYRGNVEIAELLIAHGADVNRAGPNGIAPLHMAAHEGQADVARLLIEKGADPNACDEDGQTPLCRAAMLGHSDFARVLVNNGADPDVREAHCGQTPLHVAAIQGYQDVAALLLHNGADLNAEDREGRTSLYYAGKHGHKGLCTLLESRGATAEHYEGNFGKSPLLAESLEDGEAVLWYLGHCGWAIKTKNHLMIFDYWNRWRSADEPCLANGHIDPQEIADQNVAVFVTHDHADHFDSTIFAWEKPVENLEYIFGFQPERLPPSRPTGYHGQAYTYVGPRQHQVIDGMEISTIRANDAGVGFLVKADGLTIYHAGDHAGWREGEKDGFTQEIDYLTTLTEGVDFAFVNITGCHVQDKEALYEGNLYTVDKLSPKVLIPTHAIHSEYKYKEFAEQIAQEDVDTVVYAPQNKGDSFIYQNGNVLSLGSR